ncbi:class A beta-lactamase [Kitasatospora hibisci]|uniref:class A beta-lactamase n=1 Tax=Kitasatospora hibisci TaxID=3369522 RepID=UPI0037548A2C
METTGARRSRRAVLALGAGTALAAGLASTGRAYAAPAPAAVPATAGAAAGPDGALCAELAGLEGEYAARIGLFAHDTGTGRTLAYRADELFPICSVFKPLAVAAVLRDLDRDGEFLARRIHYTEQDVEDAGYAPVTKEHLTTGMTVEELCAAAVGQSDNAAANLLLRELGGPTAVTRFCRSVGDGRTRLDRWEPELNSAEPWRRTDTTSPRAVARTYAQVLLGDVLEPRDRARLTAWMIANTTNTDRFRAGFPADWVLADKTGGGSAYGVANDVGVVRPPNRRPIVVAVHTTALAAAGPQHNEMVKRAAELVAETLS